MAQVEGTAGNDRISWPNSEFVTVLAYTGDDTVTGNTGNDTLFGGRGNDYLDGSSGFDIIYAGKDNDVVFGNSQSDILYGGKANDLLIGGSEIDTLIGNLGLDTFLVGSDAPDIITDFERGIDWIQLPDELRGSQVSVVQTNAITVGLYLNGNQNNPLAFLTNYTGDLDSVSRAIIGGNITSNPSPSPSPNPGSSYPINTAGINEILAAHNRYRAEVGVAPVVWSDSLAGDAQQWANYLASLGGQQLIHSNNNQRSGQGENLWMGTSGYYSFTEMIDTFGSEKQYFRYGTFPNVSSTGSWSDVGHYTQMIWSNTTEIGCGLSSAGGNDILVCRYSPPGNYMGEVVY